ncbi:MAG TPA: nucleotidyltransferase domain-containing protein [Polyangiales bacterium]
MTGQAAVFDAVKMALAGDARVELAIVFGSAARDRARPDSDVDLAVLVAEGTDLVELATRLSAAIGREVDVVPLMDAGVSLHDAILRDGVVIHEGAPGTGAAWWSHALIDREVDGPWYRRMRDRWLARVAAGGLCDGQS